MECVVTWLWRCDSLAAKITPSPVNCRCASQSSANSSSLAPVSSQISSSSDCQIPNKSRAVNFRDTSSRLSMPKSRDAMKMSGRRIFTSCTRLMTNAAVFAAGMVLYPATGNGRGDCSDTKTLLVSNASIILWRISFIDRRYVAS